MQLFATFVKKKRNFFNFLEPQKQLALIIPIIVFQTFKEQY